VFATLSLGMELGRLDSLMLEGLSMSTMQASKLGEGLSRDTCSINTLRMTFCKLSCVAVAKLTATLEEHHPGWLWILCFWNCSLGDSKLARLVSPLVGHSTLEELSLQLDRGSGQLEALGTSEQQENHEGCEFASSFYKVS
jgi:hypothetical protein